MFPIKEAIDLYHISADQEKQRLQNKYEEWKASHEDKIDLLIKDAANNFCRKVFIHPPDYNMDVEIKYLYLSDLEKQGYKIEVSLNNFYIKF